MLSHFQPLDGLQPAVLLKHIRSLKPKVHNVRINELLQYHNFSIAHSGGALTKDLSSTRSAGTESARVATLSNIFENRCECRVFRGRILATFLLMAPTLTAPALQESYLWPCLPFYSCSLVSASVFALLALPLYFLITIGDFDPDLVFAFGFCGALVFVLIGTLTYLFRKYDYRSVSTASSNEAPVYEH